VGPGCFSRSTCNIKPWLRKLGESDGGQEFDGLLNWLCCSGPDLSADANYCMYMKLKLKLWMMLWSVVETVHLWRHWPEKPDRNWWRETQLGRQIPRFLTCTIMSLPPLLSATVLWNLPMSSTISPLLVLPVLNLFNDAFYDDLCEVSSFWHYHYDHIVPFLCYLHHRT